MNSPAFPALRPSCCLAQRLSRAHRMLSDLRRCDEKIMTVAYDVGFGDVSDFHRVFRRRFGATPAEVRAKTRRGN